MCAGYSVQRINLGVWLSNQEANIATRGRVMNEMKDQEANVATRGREMKDQEANIAARGREMNKMRG